MAENRGSLQAQEGQAPSGRSREALPWWLFALVGILLGWLGIMLAASLTAGSSIALSHTITAPSHVTTPSAPVISPRLPPLSEKTTTHEQTTSTVPPVTPTPSQVLPPPVVTKITPAPTLIYYVYPTTCNSPGASLAEPGIPGEIRQQVGIKISH
jgi:hypothetical protein